jgi:hypothetical protein
MARATLLAGSVLCMGLAGASLAQSPELPKGAADSAVPDFATTDKTSWVLDRTVDDLLPAGAGPSPMTWDPKHPYIDNAQARRRNMQPTYRVGDLSNPILQPWARAQMQKTNDAVMEGKVPFRARERCWPIGVPGFVIYSLVEPFYFYQTPKEVTIVNQGGPEVRHVFMNVAHSKNPKPSWYGESVGHYEGGDTLVIDTIAITPKTFIDNYRTPHTDKLHVVERLKLVEGGKAVEVTMEIDDPGAFTTPWKARQRWRRVEEAPMLEIQCNENNANYLDQYRFPMPAADKADF